MTASVKPTLLESRVGRPLVAAGWSDVSFMGVLVTTVERGWMMSKKERVYVILAAAGLVLTWYHNLNFLMETGSVDIRDFILACFVNHASASIAWDVSIAAATFLTWSYVEARRLQMPRWWLMPVLTLGVALAFAFPLFLLLRERRLKSVSS
jgi:hypothetical protein